MKHIAPTIALSLGLAFGMGAKAVANDHVTELAGVSLGMSVAEARSLIEKNHPEYNSHLEFGGNYGDTTYTTHVYRRLNPQAKRWSDQEFGSIAISVIDKTGEVYQVSRGERVDPGSLSLQALKDAAVGQFGKMNRKDSDSFRWFSDEQACRTLRSMEIGVPGNHVFDTRRFNMKTQQYVFAAQFSTVTPDCKYAAEMRFELLGEDVAGYSTTIVNPAVMSAAIKADKKDQPAADASGAPKF